jgi:HK97 family phage prohead protease
MATKPLRLAAPDFARLIHRHGLDESGVREQGIIIPKAFAADVECAKDEDGSESRISTWVMSTPNPDRREDTIQVKGWKLAHFRKGGSILFAHNGRALPIGRPLKVWKDADIALMLRMEHATAEANPVAEQVWQLVKGKFLRGSSVGFIPLKWEFINEEEPWNGGINFLQQELVEHSLVPVPQNPEALVQAVGKGLDVDLKLFTDWQRMALGGEISALGAYMDDIAASLKALSGNPVSVSVPSDVPPPVPEPTAAKDITATVELPERIKAAARGVSKHATGLANAIGELEAGLGASEENPYLSDEYRKGLAALIGAAEDVANLDKMAPGDRPAADAAAATDPGADEQTKSAGGDGADADQPPAQFTPPVDTPSAHDAVRLYLDELGEKAKAGDGDALEELRSLGAQVQTLAKAIEDEAPYFELLDDEPEERDAPFFELTNDADEERADDLIEMDDETFAAAVKAAVQEQLAARMPGY